MHYFFWHLNMLYALELMSWDRVKYYHHGSALEECTARKEKPSPFEGSPFTKIRIKTHHIIYHES